MSSVDPHWTADEDAPTCQTCCARFSLLTRRHHCRKCGQVVCGDCSRVRAMMALQSNPIPSGSGAAASSPSVSREVRLCVECVCDLSAAWEGSAAAIETARQFVHAQLHRPATQPEPRRVHLEVQLRLAQTAMRSLEQRGEEEESREEQSLAENAQTDAAAISATAAADSSSSDRPASPTASSAAVEAAPPASPFVSRMKAHASRLHSLQQELAALRVAGGLLLQVVLTNATGSAAAEVWQGADASHTAAEGAPPTLNAGLYRWLIVTPPPSRMLLISSLLYPPLPAAFRKPAANLSTTAAIQSQLQSLNLPPHLLDGTMEAARSLFNVFSSSSVPASPAQPPAQPPSQRSADAEGAEADEAPSDLDMSASPESADGSPVLSSSSPLDPAVTPSPLPAAAAATAGPSSSPPPLRFWSVRSLDAVSSIRPAEFRAPRGSSGFDRDRDPAVQQPHRGFHIHFHPHAAPPPAGLMDAVTNRRDEAVLALWKQPWSCIVVDEGAHKVRERMIKEVEAQIAALQPAAATPAAPASTTKAVAHHANFHSCGTAAPASSSSSSSSSSSPSVEASPLSSPLSAGPLPPPLPPRKHALGTPSTPVAASAAPPSDESTSEPSEAANASAAATTGAPATTESSTPVPAAASPTPAPAAAPAPASRTTSPSPASSFFSSLVSAFKEATSGNKADSAGGAGQTTAKKGGAAGNVATNQAVIPAGPPPPPTAAQLAAARSAECAWLVQQDAIQCLHSSSVGYYAALSASEKLHARQWVADMKKPVSWDDPEHRQLLERLWAAYAPVLSPTSPMAGAGEAQRPGSIAAPAFPGATSESWKSLGFQGVNPVTDFRGVGLLSLRALVYLGERHPALTHVLMSLQSPLLLAPRAYPLACAGINIVCAIIGMLELDAPQQSASSGALSAREQARREELQGAAGQLLSSINQSITAVTAKIMNKESNSNSNLNSAAATAGSAAGDATAASVSPQQDHLNALMERLDRNRLWRLCLRHKSRIAASATSCGATAPPDAASANTAPDSAHGDADADAAAAAASRTPSNRRSCGALAAAGAVDPAGDFQPASAAELSSVDLVGELLAVIFPLLDDLWVEENATYFEFNQILRQTVANVESVLLRRNPADLPALADGVRQLMKRNRAERERQRALAAQLAEKQKAQAAEAQRKRAHSHSHAHAHRGHAHAHAHAQPPASTLPAAAAEAAAAAPVTASNDQADAPVPVPVPAPADPSSSPSESAEAAAPVAAVEQIDAAAAPSVTADARAEAVEADEPPVAAAAADSLPTVTAAPLSVAVAVDSHAQPVAVEASAASTADVDAPSEDVAPVDIPSASVTAHHQPAVAAADPSTELSAAATVDDDDATAHL